MAAGAEPAVGIARIPGKAGSGTGKQGEQMKLRVSAAAWILLAFWLNVGVSTARADAARGPANGIVLIIRHAEPDDGFGLSPEGQARANAYAKYFKNLTINGQPVRIGYLFAAADSGSSHRPRLTLEPTAQALGLPLDSRFKNLKYRDLVDAVDALPSGARVLIAWHHGETPDLLRAFGADPDALFPRGKWPGDTFDWLIELRYDEAGRLVANERVKINLDP